MGRRWLANLILFLVLGAIALAIRGELQRATAHRALAGIDPEDLSLIQVDRVGEPTIRVERTPDGWRMRAPMDVAADPSHMQRLLAIVSAPVYRSFPAGTADLKELGLDPPKLRMRLDGMQLAFGGLDPIGEHLYVELDGLVHLIEARYQPLLIAPPIDWVSRAILPAGQTPDFATLGGIPLAAGSLGTLSGLVAERVEPLTGDLKGQTAQVKYRDGTALDFLVSDDLRRWSRQDLELRYVLSDPPHLVQDASLVDPTPPASPPKAEAEPAASPSPPVPVEPGGEEPVQPHGTLSAAPEPRVERLSPPPPRDPADPFAPIDESHRAAASAPADDSPRSVRLRPDGAGVSDLPPPKDGQEEFVLPDDVGRRAPHRIDSRALGRERGRISPRPIPPGMGQDPFAPEPGAEAAGADTAPTPGHQETGAERVAPSSATPQGGRPRAKLPPGVQSDPFAPDPNESEPGSDSGPSPAPPTQRLRAP